MLLFVSLAARAQCKENITGQQIQKGMYILANPGATDGKRYAAEVLSASGAGFSCRFLHSNSVYQFIDFKRANDGPDTRMQATVESSRGGGFLPGTIFKINVFMKDPEPCDLAAATVGTFYDVIATFVADEKTYLARLRVDAEKYTIRFAHSNAEYTTDKSFKVLSVKNGGYKAGSRMRVSHARILQF